jgi:hypothetical protein
MERAVQPVSTRIAGEGATGAIAAVGSRCKTYQQEPGIGIAEPRYRTAPVLLVGEGSLPFERDIPAMGAKPRAELAGGDSFGQERKGHRVAARRPAASFAS